MVDGNDIWESLFGIMKGDVPKRMTPDVCQQLADNLAAMREGVDRGMVDAATALFPEGTMYRSGHDGTGPDPSLFFCEAVGPAPDCHRVRVVADTEAEARSQAAVALDPEQPR